MMEHYKKAVGKIPVPPELIAKTASSISRVQKTRPVRRRYAAIGIPAAACAAVAIIIGILLYRGGNVEADIFITVLVSGRHAQSVELVDGNLDFHSGAEPLLPPILSGPGVSREEWTQAQYGEYLGTELTFGQLPVGLTLRGESAVVYSRDDRVLWDYNSLRFESDEGGKLEITVSKGALPPGRGMAAAENSIIRGNPLATGFDLVNDGYWAQFIYGDIGYFVESENLSQEAFIRILHNIFG